MRINRSLACLLVITLLVSGPVEGLAATSTDAPTLNPDVLTLSTSGPFAYQPPTDCLDVGCQFIATPQYADGGGGAAARNTTVWVVVGLVVLALVISGGGGGNGNGY